MGKMPNTDGIDDFTIHPEGGPYGFTIKKSTDIDEDDGTTLMRQDGTPFAIVELEPDSDTTPDGRIRSNVFHRFTLTDKFLFLVKRFRVALGRPDGDLNWEDLVGMSVSAYIIHKKVGDKTFANVNNWEFYSNGSQPAESPQKVGKDGLPF